MFQHRKKRYVYRGNIGLMCLLMTACGSFKEEEPMPRLPVDSQSFRTNGVEEHLSKARAASGRMFLARNASVPGVVERPSGLQFLVIREGSGPCPRAGDSVSTHYKLFTIEGQLIDDSMGLGEPQQFEVDKVITGWREALLEMKVGAKWRIFLPAELAYGEQGLAHIPGGETLVYELNLLGINEATRTKAVGFSEKSLGGPPGGERRMSPVRGQRITGGGIVRDNLDLID